MREFGEQVDVGGNLLEVVFMYQPVQPIIEYPWDDLHYADELDARL